MTAIPALLVSMSGGLITTRAAVRVAPRRGSRRPAARPVPSRSRSPPACSSASPLIPGLPKLVVPARRVRPGRRGLCSIAVRRPRRSPPPRPSRRRRRRRASRRSALVDPLGVEVGYALVAIVDEKQGGTPAQPRPGHPAADRHRDRHGRAAGARRRQPAARPAHLLDSRQGRRGRARRALSPSACSPSIPAPPPHALDGVDDHASPPSACPPVDRAGPARRGRCRRLHGRRRRRPPSRHISRRSIRTFLPDLLSRQQTKELVDRVAQTSPKLVEELVPKVVSLGDVQRVLRQLLRERVPIRDLTTILEAMADAATVSKDPDVLTEAVRTALGRIDLPGLPDRERRAARHCALARRSRSGAGVAVIRTEQGADPGAGPDRGPEHGHPDWPGPSRRRWHNLCSCVHRRCDRTSGGCSPGRCRTWRCSPTTRCRRR